jgi:8-oxo-dGTP pyrophosphatase MutT (NUDIX family)
MASGQSSHVQYGALPWRRGKHGLEILLVTTLNAKRWIVPKGWPIPGRTPPECAAHEALEEAGLIGDMDSEPLGAFSYDKTSRTGDVLSCNVLLFPLAVKKQRRVWAEKDQRQTRWCSVEEALERVANAELRSLIEKFAQSWNDASGDRPSDLVTHDHHKT